MKLMLNLAIMISSISAFGLGNTDNSAIKETLALATSKGYECKRVYPQDFYMSRIAANGTFEIGLECKNSSDVVKSGKIVYQVDAMVGGRCRDSRAISIELNLD